MKKIGGASIGLRKLRDGRYMYVRYSVNENGSNMSDKPNSATEFIGLAQSYEDVAPTDPAEYTWTKFLGFDGVSSYTWFRYSANKNGSGMTSSPQSNSRYIGIAQTVEPNPPELASEYTWSEYKGDDARVLRLLSSAEVIVFSGSNEPLYDQNIMFTVYLQNIEGLATFIATPYKEDVQLASFTLTGGPGNTRTLSSDDWDPEWTSLEVEATLNDISDMVTIKKSSNGSDGIGVKETIITYQEGESGTEPPTGEWFSEIPEVEPGKYLWQKTVFIYSDGNTLTSYMVTLMGATGDTGDKGEDAPDAVVGSLTNPAIVLPADPYGNVTSYSGASGEFVLYEGNKKVSPNLITFEKVNELSVSGQINSQGVYSVTSMSSSNESGTILFKATYGDFEVQQILTVVKSRRGTNGSDGEDGGAGIIISPSQPTHGVYVGMLWAEYVGGPIRRWTGSYWEFFYFSATNITAGSIASIKITSQSSSGIFGLEGTDAVFDSVTDGKIKIGFKNEGGSPQGGIRIFDSNNNERTSLTEWVIRSRIFGSSRKNVYLAPNDTDLIGGGEGSDTEGEVRVIQYIASGLPGNASSFTYRGLRASKLRASELIYNPYSSSTGGTLRISGALAEFAEGIKIGNQIITGDGNVDSARALYIPKSQFGNIEVTGGSWFRSAVAVESWMSVAGNLTTYGNITTHGVIGGSHTGTFAFTNGSVAGSRGTDFKNDGRIQSIATANNPGGSLNVQMTTSGWFAVGSSATKYKYSINRLEDEDSVALGEKLLLTPVSKWYDKGRTDLYVDSLNNGKKEIKEIGPYETLTDIGVIAEDLIDVGLDDFVVVGADNAVEAVKYDRLWVLLIPMLKKHRGEILDLQRQVAKLQKELKEHD